MTIQWKRPVMTNQLRIFADLQMEMREALRAQHPEWIQPNGDSPLCDSYEARLAELLDFFADSHFGPMQSSRVGTAVKRTAVCFDLPMTRPSPTPGLSQTEWPKRKEGRTFNSET